VIDSDTEIPLSSLTFGNIWSIVVIDLEDSRGHSDVLVLQFVSLEIQIFGHDLDTSLPLIQYTITCDFFKNPYLNFSI